MAKPGFARYNRSVANASLDSKLRFGRVVAHLSDADEVSEDADISYAEITGDLLTVGWNTHQMTSLEVVDMNGDIVADEAEEDCVDEDCPDEDPRYPESLFDGFENPYGDRDDIFEDYGDLNELFIGHSSRLRFTGRYQPSRRMMSGIAALR